MPATISPQHIVQLHRDGRPLDILDVRTSGEFASAHVPGSRNVPLDALDPGAFLAARNAPAGEPLFVMCQSGARAARACALFESAGFANALVIEGGMNNWERCGLPVVRGLLKVMSLDRQVRIVAGTVVSISVLLGWIVHPVFLALAGFVGAGLVFAGATDFCGMAMLLARMPWNKQITSRGACRSAR